MDRYVELFLEEAQEHIETLSESLIALERDPTNGPIIQDIFRVAHTLKSSAAFIHQDQLSQLAHKMEDVFQQVKDQTMPVEGNLITTLFTCLDRIKQAVAGIEQGDASPVTYDDLLMALDTLLERKEKDRNRVATPAAEAVPVDSRKQETSQARPTSGPPVLTATEEEALRNMARDQAIFSGYARLDADSPMKNLRLILLLENLRKLGTIFLSRPSAQDLEGESRFSEIYYIFYGKVNRKKLIAASQIDMVEEVRVQEYQNATRAASAEDGRLQQRNIKVSSEKIDYLLNNVGELVITNSGLQKIYEDLAVALGDHSILADLKNKIDQAGRIARDLQTGIMKTRMIPVGLVFHRFMRPARDLALELGKKVDIELEGEETELDKNIVDALSEPFLHLLRNAIDHAIEKPEERLSKGKKPAGQIRLSAYQSGSSVFVEFTDDGRGLHPEIILKKAIERKLIEPGSSLQPAEIHELIFHPGFSTAETVTDISGRGVGMSVVKKMVQEFNGNIQIRSEIDRGSTFVLSFPLTLAIVSAILIHIADEAYAFPLADVVETIRIAADEITTLEGRDIFNLRGEILPVFNLGGLLGRKTAPGSDLPVLVVNAGNRKIGFIVDGMIGKREIVIKNLEKNFRQVPGLIGATLMGDGSIIPVLDVNGLLQMARSRSEGPQKAATEPESVAALLSYNEAVRSARAQRERTVSEQIRPRTAMEPKPEVRAALIEPRPEAPPKDLTADSPVKRNGEHSHSGPDVVEVQKQLDQERMERLERVQEGARPAFLSSLSTPQKVALDDFLNAGLLSAGQVLSQLLGSNVDVSVPDLQLIDDNRIQEYLPPGEIIVLHLDTAESDFHLQIMLVFDRTMALRAAADLMGMGQDQASLDTIQTMDLESVLSELTNIVGASVFNALANRLGVAIKPSVPVFRRYGDPAPLIQSQTGDYRILYAGVDFFREGSEFLSRLFVLIPDAAFRKILDKI
ncbi:MAG: chemotaxis protein CheW [Spirochaetales bacterium]|nr:chemotaxis protein CheW [Spirochaetales bacterium]